MQDTSEIECAEYPEALCEAIVRSETEFADRMKAPVFDSEVSTDRLLWSAAHLMHQAASGVALAGQFPSNASGLIADARRHAAIALMELGGDPSDRLTGAIMRTVADQWRETTKKAGIDREALMARVKSRRAKKA